MAALIAIAMMAVVSALAEEKYRRAAALESSDSLNSLDYIEEENRRVVVSLQDRKLALLEGEKVIKIWQTAVGAESTPSPRGAFTIVTRLSRPTYFHPGKVVPPGPSNPLGTRWLGLSIKGFGIHGTNAPGSIGKKASHGCIRMRNRDIEELFELVKVGDAVEIYDESNPLLAKIFQSEAKPAADPVLSASAAVLSNAN
jgi:lipoprotein-anchoring transpeptidase ErfK/SrfK